MGQKHQGLGIPTRLSMPDSIAYMVSTAWKSRAARLSSWIRLRIDDCRGGRSLQSPGIGIEMSLDFGTTCVLNRPGNC